MPESQAAHSYIIYSEFKTISPYLFPLKSWLVLNPVGQKLESHQPLNQLARIILAPDDRKHIVPRGRGHITLKSHQGSLVPCRDQSMPAPILTTLGLLPGPGVWCRSPFHSTSLRTWSLALQPPSDILKETPEPLQATGSPLPYRAWQPNLAGASEMLQEQDRKYD
jgi:hypothetical protein